MNDLAREIVAELEPAEGWWRTDTQETLADVAEEMLETMDADSVLSALERVISAIEEEHGA